jgi:hypothetical protein
MTRFAVVWIAVAIGSTPPGLSAQSITGRVLEIDTDRPILAASVVLLSGGRPVLSVDSDSSGAFRLMVPQAGWYGLRVERLGYASESSDTVEVGAHESVEVTIRLSITAVRLEPLVVVERRRESRPRSEFERRFESGRRTGLGVFITRAALDSTTALSVTALLARVPLLGMGRDGPMSLSQGGCTPTLYLNGARFQLIEPLDELIQTGTLEGIEIYRNRTELPRNFAGIGHCAAIVFWTRAGDPGRGASWRFLAGGGAILGLLVLFLAN